MGSVHAQVTTGEDAVSFVYKDERDLAMADVVVGRSMGIRWG